MSIKPKHDADCTAHHHLSGLKSTCQLCHAAAQATLARARRAALSKVQKQEADEEKPSLDSIAEEAARRREAARQREMQGGEPSHLSTNQGAAGLS